MATQVDTIARTNGVKVADIIRTALYAFLSEHAVPPTDIAAPDKHAEQPHQPTHKGHPTPKRAPTYRGNGKQDIAALKAVNRLNEDRKASGNSGERLKDTTSVR